MNIAILRRKFPEYGDVPDSDLVEMFQSMLKEVMTEPPVKYCDVVNAPGVESAVNDVSALVDKTNALLAVINKSLNKPERPEKPEKEQKDMAPHFMALGVQLQKIEAAIRETAEVPEVEKESPPEAAVIEPVKYVKSFKIKRDEIGNIESVVPIY